MLDPTQLAEVEVELARHIGPLAKVLVRKAAPLARSILDLREALAPSIQEAKARELFVSGVQSHSYSQNNSGHSQPQHRSSPPSRPMPLSQPLSRPLSQPASRLEPSRLEPSIPQHSTRQVDIPPEDMAIIEHTLSKFIGPMAKMLIRREVAHSATFKEFVTAVAGNIDHPQQREVFLQALKRALPNR